MSRVILLIFAVSTWIFVGTAAQGVVCEEKLKIGELRNKESKYCVNVLGTTGFGVVGSWSYCDGELDQQIFLCKDGTIRNLAAPQSCFTPSGTDGKGEVSSKNCQVIGGIPDYQKWRSVEQSSFIDDTEIRLTPMKFVNIKSRECLVGGSGGQGRLATHRCTRENYQLFYFRDRGKMLENQRYRFVSKDFVVPRAKWENLRCISGWWC